MLAMLVELADHRGPFAAALFEDVPEIGEARSDLIAGARRLTDRQVGLLAARARLEGEGLARLRPILAEIQQGPSIREFGKSGLIRRGRVGDGRTHVNTPLLLLQQH
jgi:hypothetical protein